MVLDENQSPWYNGLWHTAITVGPSSEGVVVFFCIMAFHIFLYLINRGDPIGENLTLLSFACFTLYTCLPGKDKNHKGDD